MLADTANVMERKEKEFLKRDDEPKIGYLDGWRGMAILLVLIGHFFPVPGINLARVGVNWFFVLSGLLMGQLLFVKNVPFDVFYKRRVTRIFPVFYLFLFVVLVWWLMSGRIVDTQEFLSAYFFLRNYIWPVNAAHSMPIGHLWSLAVEEQCYVILTLLALLTRVFHISTVRLLSCAVIVCVAAILTCQFAVHGEFALYQVALHTEYAGFGIFSSALALLIVKPFRGARWMVPLLMGAGVVLHWWSILPAVQALAGVGALTLALHLLPAGPAWVRRILSLRPLRMLGIWSYSLYLWQQPFYASDLPRPLALGGACIVGLLSFYCLEQPVRTWLNRRWASKDVSSVSHGLA